MLRLVFAAILFASLSLSACNAPISPSYQIEKQEIEVRFLSSPAQTLHIRATYHLKNIGSAPLDFLEAILPTESNLDRRNLTIQVDGHPVTSQPTGEDARSARIPFDPPWPVKSRRTLVIEYDLAPPDQLTQDSFYLHPNNWYPALLPPKHLLARADPPDKWDLRIRVPDGFLVHASGQPRGSSRSGSERVFRFTQRPDDDFRPFLLSGRYLEHRFNGSGIPVIFWTRQSVSTDDLRAVATRVGASVSFFESVFGPRQRSSSPVWVVQEPFSSSGNTGRLMQPALPEVAVIPDGVSFPGNSLEETLLITNLPLADTWLRHLSTPQGDLAELLAFNLSVWVSFSAAESAGESGKQARMRADLWNYYEQARRQYPEISLKEYVSTIGKQWINKIARNEDAEGLRNIFAAKSALFIFALEDAVGPKDFRAALRRMIQARRDLDWSIDDLRSALELESGQNLAEFFRVWLYQPGIPDDFRRRYSSLSP